MTVTLSPETQQLIADRMTRNGYASADDLIRDVFDQTDEGEPIDGEDEAAGLDPEVVADLDRSEAESDRGQTYAWAEVEAEIQARHNLP